MKKCTSCNKTKPFTDFRPHPATKDGYTTRCICCTSAYNKKYREKHSVSVAVYAEEYRKNNTNKLRGHSRQYVAAHREQARERTTQWRADNPERKKTNDTEYYKKNRERELAKSKIRHQKNKDANCARAKQWRLDNPDKVAANLANRRAAKKQAIPLWANIANIRLLYKEAQQLTEKSGIEYQVDHIVPLNSSVVCGLHCEDNLRVITAKENNSKNNKLLEELF